LFFDGLNYHGKETKVFCWYGVPESLEQEEKAPAVVLVHGGGETVFPQWVKKWTNKGYIAISIGLEGQVPGPKNQESAIEMKHPTTENSGPYRHGFFLDVMNEELPNQWFYHAVADIILANSLLRSFPEVDTTKIGITGISWGGILTNVVTGIDNRFAFAVPVYDCGYLHEAPTYMKQLKAHTPESKQFYLENWEPSLYAPLQQQSILFVDGTNDGHFSMNSFTKTYLASGAEKSTSYKDAPSKFTSAIMASLKSTAKKQALLISDLLKYEWLNLALHHPSKYNQLKFKFSFISLSHNFRFA